MESVPPTAIWSLPESPELERSKSRFVPVPSARLPPTCKVPALPKSPREPEVFTPGARYATLLPLVAAVETLLGDRERGPSQDAAAAG